MELRHMPLPMGMVSSSSASDDDYNYQPLLKKLSVLLCMPQNAPQNTTIWYIAP